MSDATALAGVWTPDTIANIIYRVVMIVVSIAFVYRQYHQPGRFMDDEQFVGIIMPNLARSNTHPLQTSTAATEPQTSSDTTLVDETEEQSQPNKELSRRTTTASQFGAIVLSSIGIEDSGIANTSQRSDFNSRNSEEEDKPSR